MTTKLLMTHRKTATKILLVGIAAAAIGLVPGNSAFVFGYGESAPLAGSTTEAPSCNNEKPNQVVLYEPNHALLPKAVNSGDVRLNWLKLNNADKYTIAFGVSSGNYSYGLPDVGNTDNFTVDHLTPGQKYFFVVRGVNGCMPGPWSREWSFTPGGASGFATNLDTNSDEITTPSNIPQYYNSPTPTPAYQPNGQPPADQSGIQQPGGQQQGTGQPGQPGVQQPLPTPVPEPGFFQGIWNSILGLFGM